MSASDIHYFGIRHHGPGSAARLLSALETLKPAAVLIEGPADCSELLALLAHAEMRPPVALMAFASENPRCSLHYPFAEFSPEYQATLWAYRAGVPVSLIDLPVAVQLAQALAEAEAPQQPDTPEQPDTAESEAASTEEGAPQVQGDRQDDSTQAFTFEALHADPIGCLAALAGYEDGESWWNDLIEQNSDSDESLFQQITDAMAALRERVPESASSTRLQRELQREAQREAFMRLEIARAAKQCDGPVAVVCGAWHVPALQRKVTAKSDREILKSLPRKLSTSKMRQAWIPWTSPKLASRSGYGAGVEAPMWYRHLWQNRTEPDWLESWLTKVARVLRQQGQSVSTASVIEAARLCHSLAAVRGRPAAGIEEIRDAVVACLCHGDPLQWRQLEEELLLGRAVGAIPAEAPLAPLLEDLQQQQRKCKLKPEPLPRELALDLRSDSGLARSTLLHRLKILDVHWGQLAGGGNSRGTFRERWQLQWEPEHAVRLVENLVYGSTIESAASARASEALQDEKLLHKLADGVRACLEAQLPDAADTGLAQLSERAAHTSDCSELLASIPALVGVSRYGTAREMSLQHIDALIQRLLAQATVALPHACRNLDDEEAQRYHRYLQEANQAIPLAELDEALPVQWAQALASVATARQSSPLLAGLCARLLYQGEEMSAESLQSLFQRTLSPAVETADAARFFDGFFAGAVQQLLYDELLLDAVQNWIKTLDDEEFVHYLPLFRRLFADLDAVERRRLIDAVLQGRNSQSAAHELVQENLPLWTEHLDRLGKLLQGEQHWYS